MNKPYSEEHISVTRLEWEYGGFLQEGLIMSCEDGKKRPSVIFVHGNRSDAFRSAGTGYSLLREGYTVFLPSQRGYGMSGGLPDFCGPVTVGGIIQGIEFFLGCASGDPERVGIWGISRGATVAALVAEQRPDWFRCAVFQSGMYDMAEMHASTPVRGIRTVIEQEAGTDRAILSERSPVYAVDRLGCPVFIIHGECDERVPVRQAYIMDEKLTATGHPHSTVIFPGTGHRIPPAASDQYVIPFLNGFLLEKR